MIPQSVHEGFLGWGCHPHWTVPSYVFSVFFGLIFCFFVLSDPH